ncbi:MAG: hypothetical protein EBR82_71430 [Caulobacteraceae bacterium]|nr:hypothetical protein [Caulobacteraceae bacterium]
MNNKIREMMMDKLKQSYLKEDKNILIDRMMNFFTNLSDYEICELYSEKYETNSKYISEQFEFKF